MTFGEKIKKQRIRVGLTQPGLAKELGVTTRTVQNYEGDSGYPKNIDIIYKLSKIFDVSTEYLMGETEAFVFDAQEKYGYKGKKDAKELISDFGGLFAGGELNNDDKDKVFKALTDIYWASKEENKKYAPKKKI